MTFQFVHHDATKNLSKKCTDLCALPSLTVESRQWTFWNNGQSACSDAAAELINFDGMWRRLHLYTRLKTTAQRHEVLRWSRRRGAEQEFSITESHVFDTRKIFLAAAKWTTLPAVAVNITRQCLKLHIYGRSLCFVAIQFGQKGIQMKNAFCIYFRTDRLYDIIQKTFSFPVIQFKSFIALRKFLKNLSLETKYLVSISQSPATSKS